MTGFGEGEGALPSGRIVAEIRSVNHRFLEVRARLPRELSDLTLFAEHTARARLRRGRFELGIHTEGSVLAPAKIDMSRAREAMRQLALLRDELSPGAEVPLSLLASVPDLFVPAAGLEMRAARDAMTAAIEAAIAAMEAMSRVEGRALADDLRGRATAFGTSLASVAAQTALLRDAVRDRLRERAAKLVSDIDVALEPGRLELEVALLCERSDVSEEQSRLGMHLSHFLTLLDAESDEPVGRRLDFLLQEMLREVNTLGAKAQDAAVSQEVVTMKVELERLREQVQNVE